MTGDWNALRKPRADVERTQAIANRALVRVVLHIRGVNYLALQNLVALKNALVEEWGAKPATQEFVDDLLTQLAALAESHDKAAAAKELEEARRAYCIRQGMRYEPAEARAA